MDSGLIGAILGGVLGVAGGAIGTYFSIKNTKGPIERAFMIQASVIAWVAVVLFVGLMFLLPSPYRYLLWIPYGILLPFGIMKVNKRLAEIRNSERVDSR